MSGKKANNNPGLYPVKGQKSGLCSRTGDRNQFLSLTLSTNKTVPHYQMLVIHPVFYLCFYVLLRPPRWLRSYKLLNRTVSCKLVSDFVYLYPSMSRDPIQSYYVPGRDIIQLHVALSYQCRCCFGSVKGFQSRL